MTFVHHRPLARVLLALGCAGALFAGCARSSVAPSSTGSGSAANGGGGGAPAAGSGPLVFTAAPLELATVVEIVPLGNLNPPGHTLPTSHIYLYTRLTPQALPPQPVYAPGDGVVQWIIRQADDAKVGVRRGALTYYVGHVVLDPSIREGSTLTAGQAIGLTNPVTYGIDLGVINPALTVAFLNPARYPIESLHGDAPLRYYEEPLRSQLYGRVRRNDSDKDGRFNFDIAGTLSGNWFHHTLPADESAVATGWGRHLAFVRDPAEPALVRIAVGGVLSQMGLFGVDLNAPDPAVVTVQSGLVRYALYRGLAPASVGTMLVEMQTADRIRVEITAAPVSAAPDFTSAAQIYVR